MQNSMAAQMAAMQANGGPVDGTPMMANMAHQKRMGAGQPNIPPGEQLNTYIYDYFLRNKHYQAARAMLDDSGLKISTGPMQKLSPQSRPNGEPMDAGDEWPAPMLPDGSVADNSFLKDWWVQFWDIYNASRNRNSSANAATKYIGHTRSVAQMQNEQRNTRMMMSNPMGAQYQSMMRNGMVNGAPKDLQRAAAMNSRPTNGNPMAGMQMKNPQMMAAQMQRDGSQMDMNGQRPQSPGADNAPSPNKRPRMEGMNGGAQFGEFAQPGQNAQQQKIEGINSGAQGSPLALGLDGQQDAFAGNGPRPGGMPPNAPGAQGQGNHALQDYQMQLMLLEQQNKKRLLMARQEQDNMSGPQHQGGVGAQGFPAAMSPQGNRPGPSPNPEHQKMRGTPKLGQMPNSPLPEGAMQQQRGSPAPNMQFGDASMAQPGMPPQGMPPQFYPQMPHQSPMMRPPSSHPGANFQNPPMTPQQMEAMRNGQMQNGAWRGNPQQPGMMPGQMGGPMGQNPPQQRQNMPPPPAPANDAPRPEPSPSQSNQAPPTPSSTNKAGPKKKATKDNVKKPANKKGGNAGTTPAASNGEEPPTPTAGSTPVAPITPHSKQSLNPQNGQMQQVQPQMQQQSMDPPFGNTLDGSDPGAFDLGLGSFGEEGALENFDFDSFLQNPGDDGGLGFGGEFDFNHVPEVGGLD